MDFYVQRGQFSIEGQFVSDQVTISKDIWTQKGLAYERKGIGFQE